MASDAGLMQDSANAAGHNLTSDGRRPLGVTAWKMHQGLGDDVTRVLAHGQ